MKTQKEHLKTKMKQSNKAKVEDYTLRVADDSIKCEKCIKKNFKIVDRLLSQRNKEIKEMIFKFISKDDYKNKVIFIEDFIEEFDKRFPIKEAKRR